MTFWENERFINPLNVTYSNMSELISQLKAKEEVENICKRSGFNINLLKSIFVLSMRGFNNKQIAEKLGFHRVTIQRYSSALRSLKESEFKKLKNYIFNIQNDAED